MNWKKGPMIDEFPTFICNTRFCVMPVPRKGGWFVVDLDDEHEDLGPFESAGDAMEAFEFPEDLKDLTEDEDDILVVVDTPDS